MKIKKNIILIALLAIVVSCKETKQETKEESTSETEKIVESKKSVMTATKFEKLNGYFVKNTVNFDKDYKYIAVSNQEDFDKYFGIAKTMNNKITPLGFDKFNVAAILNIPTNKSEKIKLVQYTSKSGTMTIKYEIEKGGDQTYTSGDMLIFKIPKGITKIDFISENRSETINVN